QRGILENNPDFWAWFGYGGTCGENCTPADRFQAADHHHERALAASARPEKRNKLPLFDRKSSRIDGLKSGGTSSVNLSRSFAGYFSRHKSRPSKELGVLLRGGADFIPLCRGQRDFALTAVAAEHFCFGQVAVGRFCRVLFNDLRLRIDLGEIGVAHAMLD